MCYEYSLRKKAVKEALEDRKEAASFVQKQVNSWLTEAKMALFAKKPKHSDMPSKTPVSVWERLTG